MIRRYLGTVRARIIAAVLMVLVFALISFGAHSASPGYWMLALSTAQFTLIGALVLRSEMQFRRLASRQTASASADARLRKQVSLLIKGQSQLTKGQSQHRATQDRLGKLSVLTDNARKSSHEQLMKLVQTTEKVRESSVIVELNAVDSRHALARLEHELEQNPTNETLKTQFEHAVSELAKLAQTTENLRASSVIVELNAVDSRHALARLEHELEQNPTNETLKTQLDDAAAALNALDSKHALSQTERELAQDSTDKTLKAQLEHTVTELTAIIRDNVSPRDKTIEESIARVTTMVDSANRARPYELTHLFEQVQNTLNLFDQLEISGYVPPMRGWAASPDALNILIRELRRSKPKVVVECGSGVSTLLLALAAKKYSPETKIVALEHKADFAEATTRNLDEHGLLDIAEVRLAGLRPMSDVKDAPLWYDRRAISDLAMVGLVFVDGPPGNTGELARRPALDALWEHLSSDAVIVMDDMIRSDEQTIRDLWCREHPELTLDAPATEKGIAIFRR